jgi:outer membrane receptor for ferrienterochelin and colicins
MYPLGSFSLRASYAAGYRTPDLKQLYNKTVSGTTINIGDPNLNPEKSSYYSLNAEFTGSVFTMSASGYINKLTDIIVVRQQQLTPEDTAEGLKRRQKYTNASEAKVEGIDVAISAYLGGGLSAGAGYSYLHSKDYDTGNPLAGNSRHVGNVNLSWNKKWWIADSSFSVNGRLQSKRYYEDEYAPTYQLWSVATSHRIKSVGGFTLEPGFGVENIFNYVDDRPFGSRYATLSPGRTVYANLLIRFSCK